MQPALPWSGHHCAGTLLDGQVFVLFIMAFAAAEVAVGLALIVFAQRRTGSVNADRYSVLKG